MSQECATQVADLLTRSTPVLNRILKQLSTILAAEASKAKTPAAHARTNAAFKAISIGALHSWYLGITGKKRDRKNLRTDKICQRSRILVDIASKQAYIAGQDHLAKIAKRGHQPKILTP